MTLAEIHAALVSGKRLQIPFTGFAEYEGLRRTLRLDMVSRYEPAIAVKDSPGLSGFGIFELRTPGWPPLDEYEVIILPPKGDRAAPAAKSAGLD